MQDRKTYVLTYAYLGHAFDGWAYSANTHRSVTEEINFRLQPVFAHQLIIVSAGRTDKGVHGHRHVVSFYSWLDVPEAAILQVRRLAPTCAA